MSYYCFEIYNEEGSLSILFDFLNDFYKEEDFIYIRIHIYYWSSFHVNKGEPYRLLYA